MTVLVDSHVHLWDPAVLDYAWLDAEPVLRRPFGPGDLNPESHGVTGVVVVEAGCRPDQALAELDWIEKVAANASRIVGVVAQAPLEQGSAVASLVADLAARSLVVGVRRNVQDEPSGFLVAPDFVAGVRTLAAAGLPFDACVRRHQLSELIDLVDRCPDVTFVLDHLGKPAIARHSMWPWLDDLHRLAQRPNVVAKLSGLTTEANRERWESIDILPYLREAIEAFGPRRCMFGSDWPVATLATEYDVWLRLIQELVAELPAPAQADVFGGTATRVYGLAS